LRVSGKHQTNKSLALSLPATYNSNCSQFLVGIRGDDHIVRADKVEVRASKVKNTWNVVRILTSKAYDTTCMYVRERERERERVNTQEHRMVLGNVVLN
jgi:hypothetical protein